MFYDRDYFEKIYDASSEGARISAERGEMLLRKFPFVRRSLDIGCGLGDVLAYLETRGISAQGVDVSSHAVAKARKRVKGKVRRGGVGKEKHSAPNKYF